MKQTIRFTYSFWLLFLLLSISTQAQVSFNGTAGNIADNQNWISFPCTVSGLNPANINTTYGFEKLTLTISHNNVSDLEAHLIAPDGTDVPIFTYVGGTGNNFTNTGFKNTYTNPIANGTAPFNGSYKPEGDLGLFNNGQNGNGTWYLRIRDNSSGYTGSLVSWSIRFGSGPAIPYTVVPFSTNLPIVILNTGGIDIPDEPKIPAGLQIINNTSGINTVADTTFQYQGVIGIEQRGSSSGSADKKSYGFETWDANYNEIDTILLGMPAQSDWILSASHFDKTLMRNVLTYKLFNDMNHYASRTQYCELYLNGVYKGVYILMEKIKRDPNRVDIAKLTSNDISGDDVSGGYIVKVDKFTGSGGAGFSSNYPPVNPSGDGIYFQYEYPSADSIVPQQQAYIQAYIDSFEAALFGANFQDPNNGFRRYAGERTFMDFMFINEISKNVDGYRLSTYFYKDKYSNGGKLKAGPAWDFDISYMNANYCQAEVDTGWGYNVSYVCPGAAVPAYWERMMSDSLFRMRVRCRWASFRQGILHTDTLLAYIDSTVAYINAGQQRNFTTWPILGQATWPEPNPIPQSYAEEIQRLKGWLVTRLAWLDSKIYAFDILNLNVNLGADTTLCGGNVVALDAGSFDKYQWSNGLNAAQINVSASGTYTITVSDDFGCSGTDSRVVIFDEQPVLYLGADTTLCNTGSVTLDAGTHSTYTWSDGSTAQQIVVSQQGNYAVTVADDNTCTASDNISVNFGAAPNATFTATPQAADVYQFTPSGTGLQSSWSFGDGATSQANAPSHQYNAYGTYQVVHTLTDANGCTASDTVNITVQETGIGSIAEGGVRIYPNPATNTLNITSTETDIERIELIDVLGQTLYIANKPTLHSSIDVSGYAVGAYLVRIHTAQGLVQCMVYKQ